MDEALIDTKVLSAPPGVLVEPDEPLSHSFMMRIHDCFAELIAAYPERLLVLATIDAFEGEAAAQEVVRTVQSRGCRGSVWIARKELAISMSLKLARR